MQHAKGPSSQAVEGLDQSQLGMDDAGLVRFLRCAGCGGQEMRQIGDRASGTQYGCDFDLDRLVCTQCGEEHWW